MIEAVCDCGAVRMEIDHAPEEVTSCSCNICRKLGTLWAYYPLRAVRILSPASATSIYMRGDKELEFHSCKVCACTTHWAALDKSYNRMAVNARLMPRTVMEAARVRKIEGPGG